MYHLYTTYILPSQGLYATDPTFYGNQKQPLTTSTQNFDPRDSKRWRKKFPDHQNAGIEKLRKMRFEAKAALQNYCELDQVHRVFPKGFFVLTTGEVN